MRRTASEIIRNLEMRIARLERQSKSKITGFTSPRDRRVTLRNSIMDNPRNGTVYALEFTTGKSHKFYEIIVDGKDVITNYGSIGSKGRTQTKSYEDNDEAMYIAEEQYKAKRKKGYIDIFDKMRNDEAIGKYSPKGYDPYGTIMSALTKNRAIETSTESEIASVWPEVSYQGDDKFLDNYSSWMKEIQRYELPEGMDTDVEDGMTNVYQVSDSQECYLGYNQKKDIFVMGFDVWLDSAEADEMYSAHQDAVERYEEDYEDWQNDGEEDYGTEPDQYDYEGYDEYWDDNEPENMMGSAIVAFRVKNGKIDQVINTEVFGERFYGYTHDQIKRKYSLVDLRLD